MKLQSIKVSQAYESATNPRGDKFEGPTFNELVASVKERGVLVPVIVRPKKNGNKLYEIVAGNRRFRASVKAGLKEIPARIEEYSDEETQEVQIIENLQREDVHPIEEGIAYRKLIEESNYNVKDLALRVGKSESYVRYRLFLTNLIPDVIKAFRAEKIKDGHAQIIGKLSPDDQARALEYAVDRFMDVSVKELQEWVDDEIYDSIKNQPWLRNKEANEYIGACTKCPPNVPTLFGEVKEGACTDKECWKIKMKKYLKFMIEEKEMLKIGESYGMRSGTLFNGHYVKLPSKKSERCEGARQGVIIEGKNIGKVIWICVDPKCKKHGKDIDLPDWFTGKGKKKKKKLTEEEKQKQAEKEEKQREKERAKQERAARLEAQKAKNLAEKATYPLTDKMFDVLFDIITRSGKGFEAFEEMAIAREWEAVDDDYDKTLQEKLKTMDRQDKLRILVEEFVHSAWGTDRKDTEKILKKL